MSEINVPLNITIAGASGFVGNNLLPLIKENFRVKALTRKSKENAAQARQIAVDSVKQEILTPYGGEFEHVQDVIDDESVELDIGELKVRLNRAFGDAYAKLSGGPAVEASEEDYLSMIAAMDVFEDDEDDVLATTDQISPPGFMPGEGGDY